MPDKIAAACPDVMFGTNPREVEDVEYVSFANKHLIHRIVEASGRVRWYGCRHGLSYTRGDLCKKASGLGLSPASMENLADVIKFFLRACEEAGAFCELYSGTLIGMFIGDSLLVLTAEIRLLSANPENLTRPRFCVFVFLYVCFKTSKKNTVPLIQYCVLCYS